MESIDRHTLLAQIADWHTRGDRPASAAVEPLPEYPDLEPVPSDDVVSALMDLRAPDAATIIRGLTRGRTELMPLALPLLDLLARPDVARETANALVPLVPNIIGMVTDVVLDTQRPLAARRRAARLLSVVSSQRAASALDSGLDDDAFDIRYACGRVLLGMREQNPLLRFDGPMSFERARRELTSARGSAELRAREVEHAFNVMSLTLPLEPTQLAFGAMQHRDPFLRGVALEYLDTVLPAALSATLAVRLAQATTENAIEAKAGPRGSDSSALHDLLLSREEIQSSIDVLRRLNDSDENAQS